MTDDPRTPLCRELDDLGVWTLQRPGPDFADRVLQPVPPTRRRTWVVAAAAVVLATALGWWVTRGPERASGSLEATGRATVVIAERSRVVAEPDTHLDWSRKDGTLVVEQATGEAFYRIDPDDGPVRVHTPAADVTVTGTCFTVHLEHADMKDPRKTFAAGAALALAATVTVYEGSVVLANETGSVQLDAGDRGRARSGVAPTELGPDATAEPESPASDPGAFALRQQNRRQAAELERLRQQLDGRSAEPPAAEAERPRFAAWGPPIPEGFDHYTPTEGALAEMAECGIVAWDQPPVWADDHQPDPEYLDALDLDAQDREAFVEVFETFRSDTIAQARRAYVELGGDPKLAEAIDPSELIGMVYGRTTLDAREEARIAMAMERAGLAEPPTGELSPSERFLRWDAGRGDAFERVLAQRFGDVRAQELREARGGWPGKRTTWADLCSERR